ncbi:hypothetical protein CBR_g50573 [Chara braunii]|uniref:Uncharacterized protein n=1 Tax=Chara braunii TaxID=69332 RepID=A0A388M6V5_CHABU|nr:hypothetical protein CBR_g50573 [Chara braunii]|eukprot:GBG90324.1 hypothetical protein CBR_g50573 [Chara braunii]
MHCPQSWTGSGGRQPQLKQSMLIESDNKPGVWYVNASQYRGWIFDDNLETPGWVWVLNTMPAIKPDIYPPYDSQTGAKRMEDKEVGYITKPMIDDATVLDDKQRLQTMTELHKLGQEAELAFLENKSAREEAKEAKKVAKEEGRKDSGEQQSRESATERDHNMEEMEVGEDGCTSTTGQGRRVESQSSLNRKISDRESTRGDSISQGPKRTHAERGEGEASSQPGKDQDLGKEEEDQGHNSDQGDGMEATPQASGESSSSSSNHESGRNETAAGSSSKTTPTGESTREATEETVRGAHEDRSEEGTDKMSQDLNDEEDEEEEDNDEEEWEDAEREEEGEEEPETLAQWIRTATGAGEGFTTTNRFEWLKKEQEVNEFYAAQYAWKARPDNNDITVHKAGYAKQFVWPKTYQPQGLKRSEQKRKMQQEAADKSNSGDHETDEATNGREEDEQMEEEKRQAAILEARINVLKDQNRELEADTINLQKIASSSHMDIKAAAKLYAKHNPGRRVIIPFRWNNGNSDWEVAIQKSLALLMVNETQCSQDVLKELISDDLPRKAQILGSITQDREEWDEKAGGGSMVDYRPIMIKLQEKDRLAEGLVWMPWQVVETIPYGLLGGLEAAEWVARGAAIVTRTQVFSWLPDYIANKIAPPSTEIDWSQTGS